MTVISYIGYEVDILSYFMLTGLSVHLLSVKLVNHLTAIILSKAVSTTKV